jgi:hypothetical protein
MRVLYPKLLDYILQHYRPMKTAVPLDAFEMYYMPQSCGEKSYTRLE